MANYKTGAQRYNDRMDKIFAKSKELNEKYHGKDSFGSHTSKHEALEKKKMVSKPTGGKMRVGSRTHQYWEDIKKRVAESKKYGD